MGAAIDVNKKPKIKKKKAALVLFIPTPKYVKLIAI
jgi:hypothetical protein